MKSQRYLRNVVWLCDELARLNKDAVIRAHMAAKLGGKRKVFKMHVEGVEERNDVL